MGETSKKNAPYLLFLFTKIHNVIVKDSFQKFSNFFWGGAMTSPDPPPNISGDMGDFFLLVSPPPLPLTNMGAFCSLVLSHLQQKSQCQRLFANIQHFLGGRGPMTHPSPLQIWVQFSH